MSAKVRISKELKGVITRAASIGMTWDDLEKITGINKRTLQRHCQEEYDSAQPIVEFQLANRLFQMSDKGSFQATSKLLDCKFGWKAASRTEITGENGDPIRTEGKVELSEAQISAITAVVLKEYC
jgi:hypothetical protein